MTPPTPDDKYDAMVAQSLNDAKQMIVALASKIDTGFAAVQNRFDDVHARVTAIEIKHTGFEERIRGTYKGAAGLASAVGAVLGALIGFLISLFKG